ncbi:hypothetical protein H0H81_000983 [Sphagnurus paluster]|uniref:DUF7514 domain-containing protein n=1 Tax=Sphagnurus paluster TaxID=117069 RepID=A0A9P7FMM3_9AGAR|nr:hypothetical protein H0H81_000983 [Sphagnurus paluster]
MQVFKESGGGPILPVPSTFAIINTRAPLATPPNYQSPPPPSTQPTRFAPPPLPARQISTPALPSPPASNTASGGWQPFFHPDTSPTPTFLTFMNDIFSYLDPTNLGHLLPETFSRFFDDMGYLPSQNAWKLGYTATFNQSKESNADIALKNTLDLFSIEHNLLQRVQGQHVDPTGLNSLYKKVLGNAAAQSLQAPAPPMPAITRRGFIDFMTLEVLAEPSRQWGNLSRLLRKYNLPRYRGWGDLPRSVIPALPDEVTLQKIKDVQTFAQQKAENEVAAMRAKTQLEAKGRQAALDLIDGPRYRYYY